MAKKPNQQSCIYVPVLTNEQIAALPVWRHLQKKEYGVTEKGKQYLAEHGDKQ